MDSIILTQEMMNSFKAHLQSAGYAIRSINSMLAAVNSLLAFLGHENMRVKAFKLQREVYCTEEKRTLQSRI